MAINDPRDIPDLLVWYSAEAETSYADGAVINQWTDLSGNGNHAVKNGSFDPGVWKATGGPGGGPYILNAAGGSFLIPTAVTAGLAAAEVMFYLQPPASGDGGHWMFGSAGDQSHYPYAGTIYDQFGTTIRKTVGGLASRDWQCYSVASRPGEWTARIDGAQVFTTSSNAVGWRTTGTLIGSSGAGYNLRGYSAFILYGRTLTAAERADLDDWRQAHPSGGTTAAPTVTLAGAAPSITGSLDLTAATPPPAVNLAGTSPVVTGSLDATVVVAPVAANLAAQAPRVAGSLVVELAGVVTGTLAGTTPAVSASFDATASGAAIEAATNSVNRRYGMTLVTEWSVSVEPPITEPKRQRAHDEANATSLPEPTLVDGRPT